MREKVGGIGKGGLLEACRAGTVLEGDHMYVEYVVPDSKSPGEIGSLWRKADSGHIRFTRDGRGQITDVGYDWGDEYRSFFTNEYEQDIKEWRLVRTREELESR